MIFLTLAAGLAVAAGLALAGSGGLYRRAQAGMSPRNLARRAAGSLTGAVVLTYAGLAMLATPAVLQVLPRSALTAWPRLASGLDPGDEAASWLAACLLLVSACAVAVRARRCRRQRRVLRVEPGVGRQERRAGFDLVTLPGAALVAYSLGCRRPQIVLSEGLRSRLDNEGVAAVVAHEAAHLRARHDRWLHLAGLADAALWFVPWVRSATGGLRLSLEQWADEDAAREVGRQALRAALLAAAGLEPVPSPAAALSVADALAERLAMLAAEPGEGARRLGLAGMSSLAAVAAAGVAGAGGLGAALAVLHQLCGT